MSDAMQVMAVAGAFLTVAQVIAALPGGRRESPASAPVARSESQASPVPSWFGPDAPAVTDARGHARSDVRL